MAHLPSKIEAAAPERVEMRFAAPLEIEAAKDEGGSPRVRVTAYNGGALRVGGFPHPVVMELKSASFETDPTPLLRDHDASRPVGHTTRQEITAEGVYLEGDLSVPGGDTDRIEQSRRNGFPWKASIGANKFALEFVRKGQAASVNGKNFVGPIYVARNAKIYETSILSLAADSTSAVDLAASLKQGVEPLDPELKEYIEAKGFDAEALTEEQVKYFKAQKDAGTDGASVTDHLEAGQLSTLLTEGLVAIKAELKADQDRREKLAAACGGDLELLAKANAEGWSPEKAQIEAQAKELTELRASRGPAIHGLSNSAPGSPATGSTIECALAMSAACGDMTEEQAVEAYGEQTVEAARPAKDITLHAVMASAIQAAGMSVGFGVSGESLTEKYFEAHRKLEASGQTGHTLSKIFQNVQNKRMLSRYRLVPSVIGEFTTKQSTKDFKPVKQIRVQDLGELELLGKGDTIAHGDLTESEYTFRLETYAKMLTLSREDMINDDMGALQQIVDILSRMSFKVHERLGVQKLLNASFYDPTNSFSGASYALGIDSVVSAETAFAEQTDASGHPIIVGPDRLICGPQLKRLANNLHRESTIETVATGDTDASTKHFTKNDAQGLLRPVVTPYIGNALVTGYDKDAWFVLADPNVHPAFTRIYLNGNEAPQLSSADVDFNKLGMSWRTVFDFGFGELDKTGVMKFAP